MTQFNIPAAKFDTFNAKINRIVNKCKKAGLPFVYEVGEMYDVKVRVHHTFDVALGDKAYNETLVMHVIPVELDVTLKHNGWKVLGCVKDVSGIRQAYFNDTELAKQYIDITLTRCDHCHTKRNRKSVCVVRHEDGREMIIGTTCLKEFTCGLDGSLCTEILNMYDEMLHMNIHHKAFIIDLDAKDMKSRYDGCCVYMDNVEHIASIACALIDKYGFVSSGTAMYYETPTWRLIKDFERHLRAGDCELTDKQKTFAHDAVQWCANLTDNEIETNFMFNLHRICEAGLCTSEHYAMVTSLIPAYKKALGKILRKKEATSEWISEEGKRISMSLKLIADVPYSAFNAFGEYTKHMIQFEDENGNILVWFTTTNPQKEIGSTITVTGTVKRHSEYKGTKQTELTRCKLSV